MLRGLQAGFGTRLGNELLNDLKNLGVDGCRIDCQNLPAADVYDLTREVVDANMHQLTIVSNPDQLRLLQPFTSVEVLNEPDLADIEPFEYAAAVQDIYEVAQTRGIRVWAGVVSNLNRRGLDYLAAAVPDFPAEVDITVHRYPHDTYQADGPTVPHSGFRSREAEVAKLKQIIGPHRSWGVSEFGYHTAKRPRKIFGITVGHRQWTDEDVAAHVEWEWNFWERMGASFAVLYQCFDGEGDGALDHYGIQYTTGVWKPVASTFEDN